jgi:ribonucleotide reductase beta subunit family protein with ferritin-like domain
MQNQLLLFERIVLEKDLNRVWKQLTVQQKDRVTLLLATLIVRSTVVAKCVEQPLAEAREHSHD